MFYDYEMEFAKLTFAFFRNLEFVLVTIPVNKTYGNWTLTASEDKTNCEVKITARSTFGFILTTFLKKSSAEGNAYQVKSHISLRLFQLLNHSFSKFFVLFCAHTASFTSNEHKLEEVPKKHFN